MHPVIVTLLSKLRCCPNDESVQEDAILALGFVLERSSRYDPQFNYANFIPASLENYRLDVNEQESVVMALLQLVESGLYTKSGVFWAIGKSQPEVIARYLSPFVVEHWKELDVDALCAALQSLINALFFSREQCVREISALLRQGNLQKQLLVIQQTFASGSDVKVNSERLSAMIDHYGAQNGS